MEPTVHDTVAFLRNATSKCGGSGFDVAAQLDNFRDSCEFPLHLGAILASSNDLQGASLNAEETEVVASTEVRQMAGLLLKQVVKSVNSVENVEEYLLGGLCDEERSIRAAAANCISAMMSSESLSVWPTLPQKLQQMCEHGSNAALMGATKCIALVCEDNSHELVTSDFSEFQTSLFGIISQCVDHEVAEVRYQCFCAVRDVMQVVFNPESGAFGDDIEAGNFSYDDLLGGDCDDDDGNMGGGGFNGPKIDSGNVDLLASIVCPRLLHQYASVAECTSAEAEQFRCVLLQCTMSLMSQWRQLLPILGDMMPMVVKTLQGSHANEMSATYAAELISEICDASELGGYDFIVDNMQDILQGLLNAISLDEFTLSFFELGPNSNVPDDEPNVKIISGRIDENEDTGVEGEEVEQGERDAYGEDDEADASGSGLRPKAKWCLNCLSTAFQAELVEAIPTVFSIILANDNGDNNKWVEKEAALTMLAELCDELYPNIPQQGVDIVLNTCSDVLTQSPVALMRSAAIRCLLHLLHGQAAAVLDEDHNAPSFSSEEVLSLIAAAICDDNKYVQRVAIDATEKQIHSALRVWASEDETINILEGFGVSPDNLTGLFSMLIKKFDSFQLQSRVSLLALFSIFAENDPVHGCLANVADDLLALLASYWDSLSPLCYENAAVINCLCDILESLTPEQLSACSEGVVNRCTMLCQVARESPNNHAAGDIAAMAMDTISTICDSLDEFVVPADLLSIFLYFAENAGTEWQVSRAALGVIGDFAKSNASNQDILNEAASSIYALLGPMMDQFDQVTTRVRSNALFCLSQWLSRTVQSLAAGGMTSAIQNIAADSLSNMPAHCIYNTNVVFCCLHLFNHDPHSFDPEFLSQFFVTASKTIGGIEDETEQADAIFLYVQAINVFAEAFGITNSMQDIAEAVMNVAVVSTAEHLCGSNEALHVAVSELLAAMLDIVPSQALRSSLESSERRKISQCFSVQL